MFIEFVSLVSGSNGKAELRVLVNTDCIASVTQLPRGDITQITLSGVEEGVYTVKGTFDEVSARLNVDDDVRS